MVEDSQHFSDLLAPIRALDYATIDHETLQHSAFPTLPHPIDLAEERGVRLLTTDFRAGDLVRSLTEPDFSPPLDGLHLG